ncbi:T9SS type A sorting domain-containing protein [bacterium]|nr:T9SS type A sorting domain-containing protein [bacterium]
MRNAIIFTLAMLIFAGVCGAQTEELILRPCEDVYIKTFGGGEGCNTFLKFDISALTPGQTITNVELRVYVFNVGTWDGDMLFWNANNQAWNESSTANEIWNSPFSDTVSQPFGFGAIVGPAVSTNLADIFNRDYEAGRTYCTIVMKDPDDGTSVSPPDSDPFDSDDTLKVGNWLFGEGIMFRPREYSDTLHVPRLVITYTPLAVEEQKMLPSAVEISTFPNPFNSSVAITAPEGAEIEICDLNGKYIEAFDKTPRVWTPDKSIASGIYLVRATVGNHSATKKLVLIK